MQRMPSVRCDSFHDEARDREKKYRFRGSSAWPLQMEGWTRSGHLIRHVPGLTA